jgi:DNA polymerase III subunit alpha
MSSDSQEHLDTPQNFVHLRAHSEYSLRDGILRIKPTMARLAEMQMPAIALTDFSNLFAAVKFYRAAVGAGIKPIFGCDFILSSDEGELNEEFSLLVIDGLGYKNLIEIISRAYVEGQERGEPRVRREWLTELNSGLICLSGASRGDVGQWLLKDRVAEAREAANWWNKTFPDRFYLEVQRTGRPGDEEYLHQAVNLASALELPIVATNDVRFIEVEDFEAHETRVCIHDGFSLADPRKVQKYSEQQYLRSAEEMSELFSDLPEAIENTVEIAKRCNLKIELGESYLPAYPTPEGSSEDDFLRECSREGLRERLRVLFPDIETCDPQLKTYWDRLEEELDIIIQMGFPGYFLIVMDFIRWAKDNKIPVGPGRGSGAGSLVAYALKITDLDPIHYDLLFERFLNPERVSLPDFDVDFCMEGRDRVIDYVADRYGREAVSQIVTFGTMAAKAVVKDVARVQGKSYGLADRLSKMIPFEVGMTLSLALEQEKVLQDFLREDAEAQEIWDMAEQLEGIARNCGKHAGGVVIAPTKLTDFAPLYCDDQGGSLVTQYDKDDVESVGLVKFDFLGLRTLTIIDWAVRMVNAKCRVEGVAEVDIDRIPLEEPRVYEMLRKGETSAVFQLESRGMRDLIKKQRPESFEDIISLVALFRPGPLQSGMVDDFVARKNDPNATVSYPHPKYQHEDLIPVLKPTYGIILYQEQVMQIAQVLAGYSLGEADLLRRAMGKKKAEEMAKQRQMFMQGASGKGISEELSSNIFDLMEKFAGYGFNKSHSAAYALVAYQTAWLKAHHPAEFMAAVMSADMQNTDKIVGFIDECKRLGLDVTPPDVNTGQFQFSVNKEGQVVYGLGAIKGLGEGAIQSIIDGRQLQGPYTDIYEFCGRIDQRKLNRRGAEALLKAGALDNLNQFSEDPDRCRAVLESQLEEAVQIAEQANENQASGMTDMFGDIVVAETPAIEGVAKTAIRPWTMKERLQKEKDTLGLYLTGHPVEAYADELKTLIGRRLCDLRADKKLQWLGGLLVDRRQIKTKRGDQLCILTLDDQSARVEVTLFSDMYASVESSLVLDTVIAVEGTVQYDDYSGGLRVRAEQLMPLLELRSIKFNRLRVDLPQEQRGEQFISSLRECLQDYRGGACSVRVKLCQEGFEGEFELGEDWKVEPNDDLLHELRHNFGADSVVLEA